MPPTRTLSTADGTNNDAYTAGDWALAVAVGTIWGSSFLWTAMGLDSLDPSAVAFLRVALGAVALWCHPRTRRPVPMSDWSPIVVVAIAGNAGPALLFSVAQQHVESSVAGMVNATTPLAVLVVTVLLTRRSPGHHQVAGLVVGAIGVGALSVTNVAGAGASLFGMILLIVAVAGYGVANNAVVPLQQAYGAPAVVGRALAVGSVVLAPLGVIGLSRSSPTPASITAVTVLGVAGTGLARALNATLAGRTGAARGALPTYLTPVVAIVLGVLIRGDDLHLTEAAGTCLVLAGAVVTSRQQVARCGSANQTNAARRRSAVEGSS